LFIGKTKIRGRINRTQ